MKVSILDQSPVVANGTQTEALQQSLRLAQAGERWGYERYWIAEHHDLKGLACSNPDVMLSYIGAQTSTIRIGAGAVLLPHYKPYKVAETYNMLATLFSNRIDVGIGRAPGGSAEATMALSDNYLEQVRMLPDKVKELLQFFDHGFPKDHMFSKVAPSPVPSVLPQPWILGTSGKSAKMAAENGLPYTFGHFMSEKDGKEIAQQYKQNFQAKRTLKNPQIIVTVSVICAETTEEAEQLAMSSYLWQLQQQTGKSTSGIPSMEEARNYCFSDKEWESITDMKQKSIVGNPKEVVRTLKDLQQAYQADEMMIVTITPTYEARLRSYELIANELNKH